MIKIINKINFEKKHNRMQNFADTKLAIKSFNQKNNNNLRFLLKERFEWMNRFINYDDIGIEFGSGAGFSKFYIKCSNFSLSDLSNDEHLDFKNVDAQSTEFKSEKFDFIIASNMIHHVPYPIKFFHEMFRILKKNGKLIIFESYCSLVFQLATIIMKHEGFDFTVNVWDDKHPKSSENDAWSGNIAVPHLIFDDKKNFQKNLGDLFNIEYEKLSECLIFLNSGGVTSKTKFIPLPIVFLKIINLIDKFLVNFFPSIFCMGRKIVLRKI